jgi:hypothetical protein
VRLLVQQFGSTLKREAANPGCRVMLTIPERAAPDYRSLRRLRGWAERTQTGRCHFDDLCCNPRAKGLRSQKCSANQREFAQYFNRFAKMTFASSSPLSPARQYGLTSDEGW